MRILEVNKFAYLRRGAERHFLDLIALLERRGHEVGVFAMRHPENPSNRWEKFFVSFVGYQPGEGTFVQKIIGLGRLFWSFEARGNMQRLLREWQPDIAHLHNVYHQLSPSILGPLRAAGIPIVMTVHDYNLISPDKDAYDPTIGRRYWKFLFTPKYSFPKRLLLVLKKYWEDFFQFYEHSVDLFVAPSVYVRETLVSAGLPTEKIIVWPHFASEATQVGAVPASLPARFALYGGGLTSEKGIVSFTKWWQEQMTVSLVLAGTPEPGIDIPQSERVILLGQLGKAEYQTVLERAACVVSPSRLPETFGLIALEAVLAGKPFFGYATGAFSEIIETGDNGFLAESDKALHGALESFFRDELVFDTEQIRAKAIEKFAAPIYAERLEQAFKTLIAQSNSVTRSQS